MCAKSTKDNKFYKTQEMKGFLKKKKQPLKIANIEIKTHTCTHTKTKTKYKKNDRNWKVGNYYKDYQC